MGRWRRLARVVYEGGEQHGGPWHVVTRGAKYQDEKCGRVQGYEHSTIVSGPLFFREECEITNTGLRRRSGKKHKKPRSASVLSVSASESDTTAGQSCGQWSDDESVGSEGCVLAGSDSQQVPGKCAVPGVEVLENFSVRALSFGAGFWVMCGAISSLLSGIPEPQPFGEKVITTASATVSDIYFDQALYEAAETLCKRSGTSKDPRPTWGQNASKLIYIIVLDYFACLECYANLRLQRRLHHSNISR